MNAGPRAFAGEYDRRAHGEARPPYFVPIDTAIGVGRARSLGIAADVTSQKRLQERCRRTSGPRPADQNERGNPSTCSATYEKIMFVDTGATW
jgi:hypothetical protein